MLPCSWFDKAVLTGDENLFIPTADNMDHLQQCLKELADKKESAVKQTSELCGKIKTLWVKLGISEADMQPYLSSCDGCAQCCIKILEAELSRCHELRKDNLPQLTNAICDEMIQLWTKVHISSEERIIFRGFNEVEYTEELLKEHEVELKKLRDKVDKCSKLWKQFLAMEQTTHDPERLMSNRGCRVMNEE